MTDSFVDKVKGFLIHPGEAFRNARADDLEHVLPYFAILVAINAVLSAVIAAIWMYTSPLYATMFGGAAAPVMVFFIVLVAEFIFTLVFAAWLHLWVYVVGGRKGILQTVNAVIYGSTPSLLLGWIPFIGIIFAIWSLVLWCLGIRDLQELSTGKAILAMVIAILIPLIIIVLVAAYFLVSYVTTTETIVAPTTQF